MKKILHIIASLEIGGAERVAMDLGLFMRDYGFESHYIVFEEVVGEYERILCENGQKVFHFLSPGNDYLGFIKSLKKLLKENQYQVIHAHTMFNCGLVMCVARTAGVPVRVAHAHSVLDDQHGFKRRVYETLMRKLIWMNATDCVACGVAAGQRLFGKKAFENGCNLILNGVNTDEFRFSKEIRREIRKTLHLEGAFVVGHSGRMSKVKNQQYLIRLMPELLKVRSDAKLLLIGDGEDSDNINAMIHEMGLNSYVIRLGRVLNVYDYLNAMDVFVFPSLYEGMPLSILEVQASGLPGSWRR